MIPLIMEESELRQRLADSERRIAENTNAITAMQNLMARCESMIAQMTVTVDRIATSVHGGPGASINQETLVAKTQRLDTALAASELRHAETRAVLETHKRLAWGLVTVWVFVNSALVIWAATRIWK